MGRRTTADGRISISWPLLTESNRAKSLKIRNSNFQNPREKNGAIGTIPESLTENLSNGLDNQRAAHLIKEHVGNSIGIPKVKTNWGNSAVHVDNVKSTRRESY